VLPKLLVIAKAPVAGHSKTRLSPPCTPEQAAELAEAALIDTLEAVSATPCGGRMLFLDGQPGGWLPEGFEVFDQVEGGLGDRLAGAFSQIGGPALLIGMDTPQVDPELLSASLTRLVEGEDHAVLGLCEDGGYWAIGMKTSRPEAFHGVPMSVDHTGAAQLDRLRELGLSVGTLPVLRDVDYFEDARQVASENPEGRFAAAFREMEMDA
jgi:rSAM/selenodomain-associated transferase 1